jgi:hypothetical protein
MADNVAITAGAGTNVATDDVGGVHYQRVKLSLGADGAVVDAVGGAGIVSSNTQRMTLASDDPAVTSLAVLDDWDESDRAKVNPIAGQAGVAAGSGTVSALTQRVVLATDVGLPAGTALLGSVSAKQATDAIMDGVTSLTPKFAIIDAATSGNNTIVAAVVGKKIRVLSYTIVAAGAVTIRFEDGADGTAKTGQMQLAANGGVSVPYSPVGHFETTANTLLNLELSGAVSVDGHLTYVEV